MSFQRTSGRKRAPPKRFQEPKSTSKQKPKPKPKAKAPSNPKPKPRPDPPPPPPVHIRLEAWQTLNPHQGFGHYLRLIGQQGNSAVRIYDRVRSALRSINENQRWAAQYIHNGNSTPDGDQQMITRLQLYVFTIHPTLVYKSDKTVPTNMPMIAAHTISLQIRALGYYQRFTTGVNTLQSMTASMSVRARQYQTAAVITAIVGGTKLRQRYVLMAKLQVRLDQVGARIGRFLARRNLAETYRTIAQFVRADIYPLVESCLRLELPLSTAHVVGLRWPVIGIGPPLPGLTTWFDTVDALEQAPLAQVFPNMTPVHRPKAPVAQGEDGEDQDEDSAVNIEEAEAARYGDIEGDADAGEDGSGACTRGDRGKHGIDTVLFTATGEIGVIQCIKHNTTDEKRAVVTRLSRTTSALLVFLHIYHRIPKHEHCAVGRLFVAPFGGPMAPGAITTIQTKFYKQLEVPLPLNYVYDSQISRLSSVYASSGHNVVQTGNMAHLLGLAFARHDPSYGYTVFHQMRTNQADLDQIGLRAHRLRCAKLDKMGHRVLRPPVVFDLLLQEGLRDFDYVPGRSLMLSRLLQIPKSLTSEYSKEIQTMVYTGLRFGALETFYTSVFKDDQKEIHAGLSDKVYECISGRNKWYLTNLQSEILQLQAPIAPVRIRRRDLPINHAKSKK